MTVLDLFTRLYGRLHSERLYYRFLTPSRYVVRSLANHFLPNYLSKPHRVTNKVIDGLIVSFTSFPARIDSVWQVVECLFRQTYLPEKIILWLSKEQFPSDKNLPESLRCRLNDRFEIRFVEGDIRSHKKYYYVCKNFPDKYIFLIDDDIYYHSRIIENTWNAHLQNHRAVICNYGYHIQVDKGHNIAPYMKWKRVYIHSDNTNLFFGSGGGTLFHPSMLYQDVLKIDLACRLTPIADDIWLNAMVRLQGTSILLLKNRLVLPIENKGDVKLADQNRIGNKNDEQIDNLNNYYGKNIFTN